VKEVVNSICRLEFGEETDDIEEIVGGLNSRTYRVSIRDEVYIVQIGETSEPHELENCVKSFRFLKRFDIPVPEVIRGLTEFEEYYFTVVSYIDGEALGNNFSSETAFNAGRQLAKIHNSKSFDEPGWIEWEEGEPKVVGFPNGTLRKRIEELMEERQDYFEEEGLSELAELTQKFLEEHLRKVPDDFQPVFVHHDFNPGNLISKNGKINAVLDLDYAHSSHSHRDLAKASNKFWLRGGKRKDIYNGYEKVRKIDESFKQNKYVYQMESLLDEIASMLQHNHITKQEALKYCKELKRIDSQL